MRRLVMRSLPPAAVDPTDGFLTPATSSIYSSYLGIVIAMRAKDIQDLKVVIYDLAFTP